MTRGDCPTEHEEAKPRLRCDNDVCIVCGTPVADSRRVRASDSFPQSDWVECKRCGLLYLLPMPTDEEIASLYEGGFWDAPGQMITDQWLTAFRYRARSQCAYLRTYGGLRLGRGTSVLEIGSGGGVLLAECARRGCTVLGIEPDPALAEWGSARFGVAVQTDMADHFLTECAEDQFDVVIFSHVFEHLPRLDATLGAVRRVLRSGGVFFVEVPNSQEQHRRGATTCLPHTYGFTGATLRALLEKCGYEVVSQHITDPNPYASLNSLWLSLRTGGAVRSSWWWSLLGQSERADDDEPRAFRHRVWAATSALWRSLYLVAGDAMINRPVDEPHIGCWLRALARLK